MKLLSTLPLLPLVISAVLCATNSSGTASSTSPSTTTTASPELTRIRLLLEEKEDALLHAILSRAKQPLHLSSESSSLPSLFSALSRIPADSKSSVPLPHAWKGREGAPDFIDAPISGSTIRSFFYAHLAGSLVDPSLNTPHGAATRSQVAASAEVLQIVADRILIGQDVAKAKLQQDGEKLCTLIKNKDKEAINNAVTNKAQEKTVLDRVASKVRAWAPRPAAGAVDPDQSRIEPLVKAAQSLFETYLIRLTTQLEVAVLLEQKC
ncbi:chorismate mutase aro7 [Thecaphora frezii]|nr:putative chorismate mutase [Thecaphora frezii]